MKTNYLSIILLTISLISFSSYSQTENEEPLLGLPGDDLDLYAVLELFQKSKTIEDFEKSLNEENAGIVNLDLNNDGNADFIKVVTEKDGDNFLFILQDPISEKETQDVAVISVSKDASDKISMQIIGDKDLYGKDYVVEPRTEPTKSITSNPGYVGSNPVTVNVEASTTVVVVESEPIVKYVYSSVYVPYYPTYYYGHPPIWWRPVAVVGIGIYRHNHWHHHHRYRGGYGHKSVHVHHHNHYNKYNKEKRNTSSTVNNNVKKGTHKTAGQGGSRPSTSQVGQVSNRASTYNRTATNASKSQTGRTSQGASTYNRSTAPSSYNKASTTRSMGATPSYNTNRGGRAGGGGRGPR